MSEIFLKSSNLSLGYSNQIVIKGLDIQLSYTNDYQIIGKNGAGKTTLMNFIALNFDGSYTNTSLTGNTESYPVQTAGGGNLGSGFYT